ncbi:NADP-dependent fatty aldehyde dehydrogenase [Polystyrenella longa]|uniref:NADP-dependent fatty aldehyde dehydrogenase n=1 Tax=Polystyrenella longa TaxID=2528007 RepID=A0A518CRV4_9PLAN|nr:aldehyde dehydrogenase (NADP(+)) [Polystyrenella longa]QDU81959.1 NADP-dependent fatty aldehyde dehydrogenase [Polystyrenella longa]
MAVSKVLIGGKWIESAGKETFQALNPATGELLPEQFPVSPWSEIKEAIQAAAVAASAVKQWPGERFARFLEDYAIEIEARADALVEAAHLETAYPVSPRIKDVELPRTSNQLRTAAQAARTGAWKQATIDTASNIRSEFGPLGPIAIFGPNNFPLAFNGMAGGDFAAAVAAGNPVITKGHPAHPATTRILAEAAYMAAEKTQMPPGFVQLLYQMDYKDGEKLVSHPLMGATAFTGSRQGGLALKAAADKAGKPIYLELSSINPIFLLPEVLEEKGESLAEEFTGSCLMGTGQFCTNPGLVVVPATSAGQDFIKSVTEKFKAAPTGTLLAKNVEQNLLDGIRTLKAAGAELLTGGEAVDGDRLTCQNTLLKVSAADFLKNAEALQSEAFGNASLLVVADDVKQMLAIAESLEGNLTGCLYSESTGKDDAAYDQVAPVLRQKVGRLLNDKMPTGVAVVPSMNHGGPYPSTGHPGFTSVGIPASLVRFGMLQCYDNVRPHRLPATLQDKNPTGETSRLIDGEWTVADVSNS